MINKLRLYFKTYNNLTLLYLSQYPRLTYFFLFMSVCVSITYVVLLLTFIKVFN